VPRRYTARSNEAAPCGERRLGTVRLSVRPGQPALKR
jgi:hypothetical protein